MEITFFKIPSPTSVPDILHARKDIRMPITHTHKSYTRYTHTRGTRRKSPAPHGAGLIYPSSRFMPHQTMRPAHRPKAHSAPAAKQ